MAKFVSGKWQGDNLAGSGVNTDKAINDLAAQQYAMGKGRTDIGGKLSGATQQIAGGDFLGGIHSGLVGLGDYASSSQGQNIIAGQQSDQDYASAYANQAKTVQGEEGTQQKAYESLLGHQQDLQADMEKAKLAATGQALQGTGNKPLEEYIKKLEAGKKLGLAGDDLQTYAKSTNPEAENVEGRQWWELWKPQASIQPKTKDVSGKPATMTANTGH